MICQQKQGFFHADLREIDAPAHIPQHKIACDRRAVTD
jgi:hypothetical protein